MSSNTSYPWRWRAPSDLGTASPELTAINRTSFGPRPGDFERVQQMGIDAYIDEQLHPESIDDTALEQRIQTLYPTLAMTSGELIQNYPQLKQKVVQKQSKADRLDMLLNALGLNNDVVQSPATVISELQEATLMRALYSQRQLEQVLVDFWSDHFNIYIYKDIDHWLKTVDDRDVIRKYAFGKFRDLLQASAQSPAMIEYLDNRENVKGNANENYAREVMELHTLGVNGGYTQTDVEELARAFTGWTIRGVGRTAFGGVDYTDAGTFFFNVRQHDQAPKRVLGVDLPANGGINDALQMIDVLAHHPSTALFISTKLVQRFVSDDPPAALVQRAAQTFTQSDGDIRTVMDTILHSDEFKNSFAQKVKRPYDVIVSSLRALDAQVEDTRVLAAALRLMGQGLFQHLMPNGYPDYGTAWINTNGLLGRWNLALLVAANRVPRAQIDLHAAISSVASQTTGDMVDFWINHILHRTIPDADRQKLIDAVGGSADAAFNVNYLPFVVALILASPHFQYR